MMDPTHIALDRSSQAQRGSQSGTGRTESAQCRSVRAMGTDISLWVAPWPGAEAAAAHALDKACAWVAAAEETLSRFRPDSALSQLNEAPARFVVVPRLLGAVLAAALRGARYTDGLFHPAVLPALAAAGYDRSFEALACERTPSLPIAEPGALRPNALAAVRVTHLSARLSLVERPPGMQFDLGGIAKGWAADWMTARLARYGPAAADFGGDLRVRGAAPSGWPVTVAHALQPDDTLAHFALRDGAVATSDTVGRHWQRHGRWQHHIIDPRTGRPGQGDLAAVTVIAATAAQAEVLTKACLLLGWTLGSALVRRLGGICLALTATGQERYDPSWEERCNGFRTGTTAAS